MDVVVGEGGHAFLPLIGRLVTLGPSRCPSQPNHAPRMGSHTVSGLSAEKRSSYNCARPEGASGAPQEPQEESDGCAGLFFLRLERWSPPALRLRPQAGAIGYSGNSATKSPTQAAPIAPT